jgi:polysaccharide export outer membrane protein
MSALLTKIAAPGGVLVLASLLLGHASAQESRESVKAAGAPASYVIGPTDVLNVAVWKQDDLTGKYTVEQDGTFTFPLLGRVQAGGQTLRGLELELTRRLTDGLFKDPQVTVSIGEYRSKRVFVVGEVRQPGTHMLSGDMHLIEALARAGSTTPNAADHAVIVRPSSPTGPVLPADDTTAEVIRVELRTLETGQLSNNVALRDSDTVFVPKAAIVYVTGRVRNPGAYPIGRNTTVLQALSLAGGVTEFGAANRIRIVRRTNGVERQLRAALNTTLEAGDTIVVPERFF